MSASGSVSIFYSFKVSFYCPLIHLISLWGCSSKLTLIVFFWQIIEFFFCFQNLQLLFNIYFTVAPRIDRTFFMGWEMTFKCELFSLEIKQYIFLLLFHETVIEILGLIRKSTKRFGFGDFKDYFGISRVFGGNGNCHWGKWIWTQKLRILTKKSRISKKKEFWGKFPLEIGWLSTYIHFFKIEIRFHSNINRFLSLEL